MPWLGEEDVLMAVEIFRRIMIRRHYRNNSAGSSDCHAQYDMRHMPKNASGGILPNPSERTPEAYVHGL